MFATVLLAMSVTLASERDFFHIPDQYEFRLQQIARTDRETAWAFSVERGYLLCVWGMGQRLTYFSTERDEDDTPVRLLVLTSNPFDLVFANLATADLFVPTGSIEERIRLVGPFTDMAQRLCDQPAGSQVRGGEL